MRPKAVATLAAAALVAVAPALAVVPAAHAATSRSVCAQKALLYDTPGGVVIAVLLKRDRVTVLRYRPDRRWVRVRAPEPVRGWMRTSSLCPAR